MGGSMTKVLPGLYVGGLENAKDAEELIANCISHILVAQNVKYEIEKSPSRKYLQIVMLEGDDRSLFRRVAESNDFIHQARMELGNVLVCSDSGMSANVTLVAAYLMSVYRLNRQSALGAVRGLKHAAYPVPTLLAQLDRFDGTSDTCGPDSPGHPGSPAQPELPPTPTPVVTAQSENLRLTEKFGFWPRLEEDMHLLQGALDSHKCLAESDFVPYEPSAVQTSEMGDSNNHTSVQTEFEPLSPLIKNIKWTPPRTPPSTPNSSSIPAIEHVLVPLEAIDEISRANEPITEPAHDTEDLLSGEDDRTPTAFVAPEPEIFSLDPYDNPLNNSPEPKQSSWSVHTGRVRTSNDADLGVEEIGFELQADVPEDEEDDDDVPGAIAMPISTNRISIAQSHRHGMAASYNPQSSLFGPSNHRSVSIAVAKSFAPTGLFRQK